MAVHRVTRILPYAPEDLANLVAGVEAYPEFVPWITSMRVWNQRDEAPGVRLAHFEWHADHRGHGPTVWLVHATGFHGRVWDQAVRRLPAERLDTADRVMALADIFEALTAADRPYKAPKTLSESLKIMAFMCKDQHLDTELFRYFLHSGVWREFAQRFMLPAQVDEVDVGAIEKLLPAQV